MHRNLLARESLMWGWSLNQFQGWGDGLHSAVWKLKHKDIPICRSKESLSQPRPALKARNYANLPLEAQPRLGPWVLGVVKLLLKNFQQDPVKLWVCDAERPRWDAPGAAEPAASWAWAPHPSRPGPERCTCTGPPCSGCTQAPPRCFTWTPQPQSSKE